MNSDQSFEEYLVSKKIDSLAFRSAEPKVWNAWKIEFDQVHPNSFTLQKLNLINPIRRKYLLQIAPETKSPDTNLTVAGSSATPKPSKPIIKPRPKIGP